MCVLLCNVNVAVRVLLCNVYTALRVLLCNVYTAVRVLLCNVYMAVRVFQECLPRHEPLHDGGDGARQLEVPSARRIRRPTGDGQG